MARNTAKLIGLLGGAALLAAPAAAQQAELGLHGGRVTDERGMEHTGATLAPSLTWVDGEAALRLQGQGTLLEGGTLLGGAGLLGRTRVLVQGPVSLSVTAEGSLAGSTSGYRAISGRVSPQLQVQGSGWGISAGPYVGGGGESFRQPTLGGGLFPREGEEWTDFETRGVRGLAAEAWGGQGPLALGAGWTHAESQGVAWQDFSGRATLTVGPATLAGTLGRRAGDEEAQWGSGSLELRLSREAALIGELGSYPSDPMTGRAAGQYATVGLRVRTGVEAATPRPLPVTSNGRVRLEIRAEPGSKVQLLGDWTEWKPIAVPEVAEGVYAVEVSLPSGVHRFGFRVDGEWRVPEGFPTEADGYGGKRAVLRI